MINEETFTKKANAICEFFRLEQKSVLKSSLHMIHVRVRYCIIYYLYVELKMNAVQIDDLFDYAETSGRPIRRIVKSTKDRIGRWEGYAEVYNQVCRIFEDRLSEKEKFFNYLDSELYINKTVIKTLKSDEEYFFKFLNEYFSLNYTIKEFIK